MAQAQSKGQSKVQGKGNGKGNGKKAPKSNTKVRDITLTLSVSRLVNGASIESKEVGKRIVGQNNLDRVWLKLVDGLNDWADYDFDESTVASDGSEHAVEVRIRATATGFKTDVDVRYYASMPIYDLLLPLVEDIAQKNKFA